MSALPDSQILPVFPLTGQLMLPGTFLPLNVFEPRYRNMVRDVMAGDRRIGMIQPLIPGLDNWGVPPLDLEEPDLYPVGCCGRIEQCELQEDGRYLIVLRGVARFRILRELEQVSGYRRVHADFSEFAIDVGTTEADIDKAEVLAVLEAFARQRDLQFDPDLLEALSATRLVSSLSTALPFSPVEKQALLEAHAPEDRASLLLTLMGIDLESTDGLATYTPPTIH